MKLHNRPSFARQSFRRCALAAVATALLAPAAGWADAVVLGFVTTSISGSFAGGTGNFSFPTESLWAGFAATGVGSGATGSVTFNGGTQARFRSIVTAQPDNVTTALPLGDFNVISVQDPGTKLFTQGVDTGFGSGDIYVTGGAHLDGRSTACTDTSFNYFFCGTRIGSRAPSRAALEVNGNSLYETRALSIATAGTSSSGDMVGASVDVLNGSTLRSWNVGIAGRNGSGGTETALGIMRINGANSTWVVDGYNRAVDGTAVIPGTTAPFITAGTFAGGSGQIFVENGGTLRIERTDPLSGVPFVILGNGGSGQMRVSGEGSKLEVLPGTGGSSLQLGRRAGSSGTLDVDNRGVITGMQYMAVGRAQFTSGVLDAGGSGTMVVDGDQSLVRLNDVSATGVGQLDIARGAGASGTVTVRQGGRIEILGTAARTNGPTLLIGREAGELGAPVNFTGSGTLNILGAGSVVELRANNVADAGNSVVRVGRAGTGQGHLNITAGGKLIVEGNAPSSLAAVKTTSFIVGGTGGFSPATLAGGNGHVLLSGTGSEILMKGNDLFASVGDGPGGSGQMTISDGGKFTGTLFQLGRVRTTGLGDTATGTLTMNGGHMLLSGQFNSTASNSSVGASLSIGLETGSTGIMTMSAGSTLRIENTVLDRAASLFIGASPNFSGGVGSLVMSSGSSIGIEGLAGSTLSVGSLGGTGSLTMNASSITLASNGQANIHGSALLSNGSQLNAGSFLGIAAGGGTGSLLINSSAVQASEIVIGSGGFLGGSGATVTGNVTNFGVFSPGASPGTFTIHGNYKAEPGSQLILEIESDGAGGFRTDEVIFGGTVDLNGLTIEFRFLGNTDPQAFANSGGFQINSFMTTATGSGLAAGAFASVAFTATAGAAPIAGFSFDPAVGIPAVPEPQTWALTLAGMGLLGAVLRRRRRAG